MYRITALVLLAFVASAARAEQLEPQRCGVIVWEPYPHCHDVQLTVPTCAPGYEANCQARDHGTDGLRRANPVTGK